MNDTVPPGSCEACDASGACSAWVPTVVISAMCGSNVTLDPATQVLVLRLVPPGMNNPNSLHCGLGLVAPPGVVYNLTFLSVGVYGAITVYGGIGFDFPVLAESEYITLGAPISVSSEVIWLYFSSDGGRTYPGFVALVGQSLINAGTTCTQGADCSSNACRGGRCCGVDVPALCTSCNTVGTCAACAPGTGLTALGQCVRDAGSFCVYDQVRVEAHDGPASAACLRSLPCP